jgi:hypothetical protein
VHEGVYLEAWSWLQWPVGCAVVDATGLSASLPLCLSASLPSSTPPLSNMSSGAGSGVGGWPRRLTKWLEALQAEALQAEALQAEALQAEALQAEALQAETLH